MPSNRLITVVLATGALAALPPVAAAQDAGTVTGTVTTPSPCLTIDDTSIDFGSRPFDTGGAVDDYEADSRTTVTNCSGTGQNLFVQGSHAVGASMAQWNLVTDNQFCPVRGTNRYQYMLGAEPEVQGQFLSTANQLFTASFTAGSPLAVRHVIRMPCAGSAGAGTAMSTSVQFTATF